MNKAFAVARWEYIEKVKSKTFLLGLFITPSIIIGSSVLPTMLASREDKETKIVGVIDATGEIAPSLARAMQDRYTLGGGQPNYLLRPLTAGPGVPIDAAIKEADREVAEERIVGYCVIGDILHGDSVVEYRSNAVGDFILADRLEQNVKTVIASLKAARLGLDPAVLKDLQTPVRMRMVKVSSNGEETGFPSVFITALVFLMMLMILIMTSGQMLVRSVIEEKSQRIVEVLVSSCSSTELMAGKVLGLSALGLTQMGFWALIAAGATLQFGVVFVSAGQAALLVVYFVLGYLLYAAIFIGAGSPLTTEQEAQQITTYLLPIILIPIVLMMSVMKSPDALWVKILTYIPLLTPTMMALRIPVKFPGTWEIATTILIMLVSIAAAMIVAGRIFRIAILSTGSRPTFAELLRWSRNG